MSELDDCKECNNTGILLVGCSVLGDFSHAEPCLCQLERELDFMNIHAIELDSRVTIWREEE